MAGTVVTSDIANLCVVVKVSSVNFGLDPEPYTKPLMSVLGQIER
jgi:hypothetical protein